MPPSSDPPDADLTAGRRLVRLETEAAEQRGSRKLLTWLVGLVGGSAVVGVVAVIVSVVRVDVLEKRLESTSKNVDVVNDVRADLRVLTSEMRAEASQNRAVNAATVDRLSAIERRLETVARRR